jgi:hypothetical protein
LLALCCWQGCTSGEATVDRDDPQPPVVNDGRVAVDLALSVSATNGNTRIASSDVVNPASFEIEGLSVLPFVIPFGQDSIRKADIPVMEAFTSFTTSGKHYLIPNQKMNIGVNAFLCYAKAKHTNDYSATNHGSLNTNSSTLTSKEKWKERKFSLTPILRPTVSADSTVILAYMNSIAGAIRTNLPESFNSFANLKGGSYQGLAASSNNIIAYVNEWLGKAINENIENAIKNTYYVELTDAANEADKRVKAINGITSYPGIFPDGGAVIKWKDDDGKKCFEYENYPAYAYPAERYFYANSCIVTSNASQSTYYPNNEWSTIISKYTDGNVVASTTRSVAIKNPLRYGVAGMEIHILGNGTLDVSEGSTVNLTSDKFLLTAVIVGSQVEQNCFFEPASPTNQEEDEYLIYDKQIANEGVYLRTATSETDKGPCVYTLGLQTKDDVSLKVVLEFENNSGAAFTSENGVIHPGTKFYMVASVVPPGTGEIGKRVMTRGHMTVVNLTVGSLKSAYNALPNLRSDKLRLFDVVEARIREWKLGDTGEHEVYNW